MTNTRVQGQSPAPSGPVRKWVTRILLLPAWLWLGLITLNGLTMANSDYCFANLREPIGSTGSIASPSWWPPGKTCIYTFPGERTLTVEPPYDLVIGPPGLLALYFLRRSQKGRRLVVPREHIR
jgi:hypothetical protein